jgi:cytoplasmic iron level regulating protein YaaA (DUF328/UPF0246 family)
MMIAVLSPSKDLNYKAELPFQSTDLPRLWEHTQQILPVIKKKKSAALRKLMDISVKLAQENANRYQEFSDQFTKDNSRPAIYAFAGDVYRGLEAYQLNKSEIDYAQDHLRILSGLYGLLKPMDLIQAYRLEMGIGLKVGKHKNLYSFWKNTLTDLLQKDLELTQSQYLINLASQEYFEAIDLQALKVPVINIHFREYKKNELMFVSFTAKKARGLMARFMINEKLERASQLKEFNLENYNYENGMSSNQDWYFIR